jgi:hypothetical protein
MSGEGAGDEDHGSGRLNALSMNAAIAPANPPPFPKETGEDKGGGHGNGRLNARTMNAAIAWRLTAVSGQKISGPIPQPVVIPRR